MKIVKLELSDINKIKKIWKSIEKNAGVRSLASKWEWIETWIAVYSDLVTVEVFAGKNDYGYCGITLFTKQVGRTLPFPVVNYQIGTAGEPIKDRIHMLGNTIVSIPEEKEAFIDALVKKITNNYPWEEITLEFFNKEDVDAFAKAYRMLNIKYRINIEEAYYFDFSKKVKEPDIANNLSSGTRYKIRRSIKELGDLEAYFAKTLSQANDIFNELILLHQAIWEGRGKRGMFASNRYEKFHRTIINKLFNKGNILLYRVKSKKLGTVGCIYLFKQDSVACMYQSGFGDFSQVKVVNSQKIKHGLVCHYLCMQESVAKGIKQYNFGPAEYRYKSELTNSISNIYSISATNSLKPYIRDRLWDLYIKADNSKTASSLLKPFYSLYKTIT